MGYCNNSGYNTNKTGWWYTYPSEKSWSSSVEIIIPNIWKNIWKYIVTGKDDIPYMKWKKKQDVIPWFQTTRLLWQIVTLIMSMFTG